MLAICARVYLAILDCSKIYERNEMNQMFPKDIQTKLTKNLLDTIILQYLEKESMHGYQIITNIRKDFGVYLGPSTVYPLLGHLGKKGI